MAQRTRLITLIDFSPFSNALFELAGKWCETAGADLVLVHKVAGIVPAMTDDQVKDRIIAHEVTEAQTKLQKWSTEKISPSTKVDFVVSDKSLLTIIADILDEGHNDFVVVGTKGAGMLKRFLMGSVATHIINELNITTIAVPEHLSDEQHSNLNPRRIIVTLTDKYPLNEKGLDNVLDTFRSGIESLTFVSVIGEQEDNEKEVLFLSELKERYASRVPASFQIFRGNSVFEEIVLRVQKHDDTVLVVQKGSRTLTDQLFRKFFINQLVNDGSIPMIVLPVE